MRNANLKLVQPRDEVKLEGAKVGQAVYDIMSKPQSSQEVGDTLNAMSPRYIQELQETILTNKAKYNEPFYIIVLRKKEPWALNVLRQWFVARKSRPSPLVLRQDYPNHDHDVWKVDPKDESCALQWTLPTKQDAYTILKNRQFYDPQLVDWIFKFNRNELV